MKLHILTGPLAPKVFSVDSDITLGRDASNAIAIPDTGISLVHAQIYRDEGRMLIKDLGSTNGTRINGMRVVTAPLDDLDEIVLGQTQIRVDMETRAPHPTVRDGRSVPAPGKVQPIEAADAGMAGDIAATVTYYLKRKIARGGMGTIYEAEQIGAEGFIKKVALKTILPEFIRKDSFVSSFIGEAKLVANLVHQNIVQIHQLGRHGEGYFIAMEYIDGINLTQFLRKHYALRLHVPVDMATFIISRVCRGLEYAHSKKDDRGNHLNLVHRDVSPNNIMITHEGEVKLTDFGVAKAAQFMEDDDVYLVGSVEYMSPEQADCAEVDARSDLYSLGMVYHELLTGRRVYEFSEDEDMEVSLARVKKAEIPPVNDMRADVPEDVAAIVHKCVARLPEDRYASAADLAHDLEHTMYSKGYGPTITKLAGYLTRFRETGAV